MSSYKYIENLVGR